MKPTNIDFLFAGNPCNLHCRHCYYRENASTIIQPDTRLLLIEKVCQNYPQSSFFIYPLEISTSSHLIPSLAQVRQKSVLSNGVDLSDSFLEKLIQNGIEEIKITLFATEKEQCFFNNGVNHHRKIIETIAKCANYGFKVTVNNVLCKLTANSVVQLINLCSQIGVSKIEFLRLKPVGLAQNLNNDYFLDEADMNTIIHDVETAKMNYGKLIYFSFNISFGPNFYGKNIIEATKKIVGAKRFWTKSPYLCPAIENNYWGISLQSGYVYWCFFAMTEGFTSIGTLCQKNGLINITQAPDLTKKTLLKKLRGKCSKMNCYYHNICIGGCRSTAYVFAKLRNEEEPLYAEMDICLTKSYERIFGQAPVSF